MSGSGRWSGRRVGGRGDRGVERRADFLCHRSTAARVDLGPAGASPRPVNSALYGTRVNTRLPATLFSTSDPKRSFPLAIKFRPLVRAPVGEPNTNVGYRLVADTRSVKTAFSALCRGSSFRCNAVYCIRRSPYYFLTDARICSRSSSIRSVSMSFRTSRGYRNVEV